MDLLQRERTFINQLLGLLLSLELKGIVKEAAARDFILREVEFLSRNFKNLKMISRDLRNKEFVSGEVLEALDYDESDIYDYQPGIENWSFTIIPRDDELDILKGLIALY